MSSWGCFNGFASMVGTIRNAVQNLFSGIVNGVKAALGIGSPSRVFLGIGADMMRGARVGIERNAAAVREAARAAFGAAEMAATIGGEAYTAAGGGVRVAAQPVTIQVPVYLDREVMAQAMGEFYLSRAAAKGRTIS